MNYFNKISGMVVLPEDGTETPKHVADTHDMYVVGSKCFRPDIQKPRQMENAVRDI